MNLLRRLADESALVYALVTAAAAAVGLPEAWQKVVLAALALLFGLVVRSIASSPTTLTQTAVRTAQSLSGSAAGAVGTVTEKGEDTVNAVVSEVGGLAGRLAPAAKEVLG